MRAELPSLCNVVFFSYLSTFCSWLAWLAQLVERQSAVREVEGSSPRPDEHSGS